MNLTNIHEDVGLSPGLAHGLIAMRCDVGHRCSSDLVFQWLWCRLAAAALTWLIAWELTYAAHTALKKAKKRGGEGIKLYKDTLLGQKMPQEMQRPKDRRQVEVYDQLKQWLLYITLWGGNLLVSTQGQWPASSFPGSKKSQWIFLSMGSFLSDLEKPIFESRPEKGKKGQRSFSDLVRSIALSGYTAIFRAL